MEENKNNDQAVSTEEIKKETVETVNQVKDTIKNVDIKNDAKEATGFVTSMFKNPFETIKNIINDSTNKYFKTAIVFIAVWTIVAVIKSLSIKYWSFSVLFRNILSLIKTIIAPTLGILVLSGIIYIMNKKSKKSLITIITAITTAKIPVILASVLSLLTIFSYSATRITGPFTSLCSVISVVLTYFTTKLIFNEEKNSEFIKTFVKIEAIYYVAYILISFLEIYI